MQESRKQPQEDELAVILKCFFFPDHGMRVNGTNFALGKWLGTFYISNLFFHQPVQNVFIWTASKWCISLLIYELVKTDNKYKLSFFNCSVDWKQAKGKSIIFCILLLSVPSLHCFLTFLFNFSHHLPFTSFLCTCSYEWLEYTLNITFSTAWHLTTCNQKNNSGDVIMCVQSHKGFWKMSAFGM